MVLLTLCCTWAVNGQSCCSASGASSVSLGSSSGTLLLDKKQMAIQTSIMAWGFHPLGEALVVNTAVADIEHLNVYAFAVSYGIHENLTLQVVQPYFDLYSKIQGYNDQGKRNILEGRLKGFGDASLMATSQIFKSKENWPEIGIQLGIELPSGQNTENTQNVANSMGSGSWDPIFGIGILERGAQWTFGLRSQYKLTTASPSSQLDQGDFASGYLYISKKVKSKSSINIGVKHLWVDKQRQLGNVTPNTGAHRSFAGLGYSFSETKKIQILYPD